MEKYKEDELISFFEDNTERINNNLSRDAEMIPMFLDCLSGLDDFNKKETLKVILNALRGATKLQVQSYFTSETIIKLIELLDFDDEIRTSLIIKIISATIERSRELKLEYTSEFFHEILIQLLESNNPNYETTAFNFISSLSIVNSDYTIRYLQYYFDITDAYFSDSNPIDSSLVTDYALYIVSYIYYSLASLFEMDSPPFEWIFFTAKNFISDSYPSPICTLAMKVFKYAFDFDIGPIIDLVADHNSGEVPSLFIAILYSQFKEQIVVALDVVRKMVARLPDECTCFVPPGRYLTLVNITDQRVAVGALRLLHDYVSKYPAFAADACTECDLVDAIFKRCDRGYPAVRAEGLRALAAIALCGGADVGSEFAEHFLQCLVAIADPAGDFTSECIRAAVILVEKLSREEAQSALAEFPLDDFEGIDEECDSALQSIRDLFE